MAGKDCNTEGQAPALRRAEKYWWGLLYRGERDALIAAGVARPDWFPREPGQGKTVGRGVSRGREIIVRATSKNVFEVHEKFTEAERVADADRERIEHARTIESEKLKTLPVSHGDFRARLQASARFTLSCLSRAQLGGYRLAPETAQEFDDVMEELLTILSTARTLYNAGERNRQVEKIKGESAKADAPLQRFLEGVTRSSDELRESAGRSKIGRRKKRSAATRQAANGDIPGQSQDGRAP